MNAKPLFVMMIAIFCGATSAFSQGYAGLGSSADGFAVPSRTHQLEFPRDHASHPDFRIEWWYLTANLQANDGTEYGVQWTLFRSAFAPKPAPDLPWRSAQIWMGHAALTSESKHLFDERLARGSTGQAGVNSAPFEAWIDEWHMRSPDHTLDQLSLQAAGDGFAYLLDLTATGPLVLHGEDGYSVKSQDGQASYYYAQPRYEVSGTVDVAQGPIKVTGQAWLDREWSSQPLAKDQSGWDWFSLSFDSGDKLMGFVLRSDRGDFTSGTWIDADGEVTPLKPGQFMARPLLTSAVQGREVPTKWQVDLASRNLSVIVEALNPNAWMDTSFSYWEGPIRISGSHFGRGYLEMTGYD